MSQLRKISDCVFTTPVDHQYDENSEISYDGYNNIDSIISGINCLMIETDRQFKQYQNFQFDDASTNPSSPFDDKEIFCKIEKISFFVNDKTKDDINLCIRKKKIKISKCVKKNWKTKIFNSKQMLKKSLTSKVQKPNFLNTGKYF
jgi:hypothetical protein